MTAYSIGYGLATLRSSPLSQSRITQALQPTVPPEVPMRITRAAVTLAAGTLLAASLTGQQSAHNKQPVTFKSGQLTLAGVVYKPDGPGPFPTVIWNHGSEKTPGSSRQFDAVADIFVPAGYAVVAPSRRGHDSSEGAYISDLMDAEEKKVGPDGAGRLVVRLLETEQLDDQFAGIAYAKTLPRPRGPRRRRAGSSRRRCRRIGRRGPRGRG